MKIIGWPKYSNKLSNPYNYLLYTHVSDNDTKIYEYSFLNVILKNYDILHIHWPSIDSNLWYKAIIKFLIKCFILFYVKLRKVKIVWTVHNIESHDINNKFCTWIDSKYMNLFVKKIDAIISLSCSGEELVINKYPQLVKVKKYVCYHGHYKDYYKKKTATRLSSREHLQLPKEQFLILFFGMLRPYKNIISLINVFNECGVNNVGLVIAGKARSKAYKRRIIEAIGLSPSIYFFDKHVSDGDLKYFFIASDLVVLPFVQILNSGSAILSLSFSRPVVVPNLGAMPELKNLIGKEWVYTYKGSFNKNVYLNSIHWSKFSLNRTEPNLQELD